MYLYGFTFYIKVKLKFKNGSTSIITNLFFQSILLYPILVVYTAYEIFIMNSSNVSDSLDLLGMLGENDTGSSGATNSLSNINLAAGKPSKSQIQNKLKIENWLKNKINWKLIFWENFYKSKIIPLTSLNLWAKLCAFRRKINENLKILKKIFGNFNKNSMEKSLFNTIFELIFRKFVILYTPRK